jgi:hypothetical protein
VKITINTEPGAQAHIVRQALSYMQEWIDNSFVEDEVISLPTDTTITYTVLPDGTFIIEDNDRGAPIYFRVCAGPNGGWEGHECDAEGEPIPPMFQAVGMLFIAIDQP